MPMMYDSTANTQGRCIAETPYKPQPHREAAASNDKNNHRRSLGPAACWATKHDGSLYSNSTVIPDFINLKFVPKKNRRRTSRRLMIRKLLGRRNFFFFCSCPIFSCTQRVRFTALARPPCARGVPLAPTAPSVYLAYATGSRHSRRVTENTLS